METVAPAVGLSRFTTYYRTFSTGFFFNPSTCFPVYENRSIPVHRIRLVFVFFLFNSRFPFSAGYSRIPVYEGSRQNIVTMLYIKDLALVDPDDNTLLKTLCQFYQNPCYFVFEDTTLDVLFKQFKEGQSLCELVFFFVCFVFSAVCSRTFL